MQFHTCNLYATLPWVSSDAWGFFICTTKRSLHRCRLLYFFFARVDGRCRGMTEPPTFKGDLSNRLRDKK
nr:MAG TPA: hypothetical protein [Caudoviricetes sp.]